MLTLGAALGSEQCTLFGACGIFNTLDFMRPIYCLFRLILESFFIYNDSLSKSFLLQIGQKQGVSSIVNEGTCEKENRNRLKRQYIIIVVCTAK